MVGDDFFAGMARPFIAGSPPAGPVLSEYGTGFADFVARWPAAVGLPYLADVARLEVAATELDDRPAVGERGPRRQHGRAGALALALLDDLDPRRQALGDAVTRPNNRDHSTRAGRPSGIDDPLDEHLSGDAVKHLGRLGPHPRALAGGHDEDRKRLGHGCMRVPGRGTTHGLCSSNLSGGSSN